MPDRVVIMCPGFLGSELRSPIGVLGGGKIWLNPPTLLAGGFNQLRLAIPGETNPPIFGGTILPGHAMGAYYGAMETWLERRGWRVESPIGDWRRPQAYDAAFVVAAIRAERRNAPMQLLCHSRGGLVARRALAILAAAGESSLVSRVVAMGTPHGGSFNAVQNLAGYSSLQTHLHNMGQLAGYTPAGILLFPRIREVLRSWPALYELLPKPGASWVIGLPSSTYYLPQTWQGSPLGVVTQYLADAATAWGTLPPLPDGVKWVNICGVGVDTPVGLHNLADLFHAGSMEYTSEGDGTVPRASATLPGWPVVTTPTAHDLLAVDGRLWATLHAALSGEITADVALAGRVLSL